MSYEVEYCLPGMVQHLPPNLCQSCRLTSPQPLAWLLGWLSLKIVIGLPHF